MATKKANKRPVSSKKATSKVAKKAPATAVKKAAKKAAKKAGKRAAKKAPAKVVKKAAKKTPAKTAKVVKKAAKKAGKRAAKKAPAKVVKKAVKKTPAKTAKKAAKKAPAKAAKRAVASTLVAKNAVKPVKKTPAPAVKTLAKKVAKKIPQKKVATPSPSGRKAHPKLPKEGALAASTAKQPRKAGETAAPAMTKPSSAVITSPARNSVVRRRVKVPAVAAKVDGQAQKTEGTTPPGQPAVLTDHSANAPDLSAGNLNEQELSNSGVKVGDKASAFSLFDQNGATVSDASLAGRPYVLYFYPRDNTPGCTQEACDFRDDHSAFRQAGVEVFGVSPDSVGSHAGFALKHELPFRLISDPERTLAQAYGVWAKKKNYGKEYMGVVRSTFLIGPDGTVRGVWDHVKVKGHVQAVLDTISAELGR